MYKILSIVAAVAISASAHFEILYTPQVEVQSKEVKVTNFFSHPFDGEHLMNSGRTKDGKILGLKEAFLFHKGKKSDLTKDLTKVDYSSGEEKAAGYDLTLNKSNGYRSAGDYAVVIVPNPYWEPGEGLYIQQITKLFINKGGFDTDWSDRCVKGYTEIIPLTNPYSITTGGLVRAKVVDGEGKPVEGATIEVEYLNHSIDMENHKFTGEGVCKNEKIGTKFLITDANGIFAFIPQKSGFWGMAALSAGSTKKYKGEELEQDPVIWIKVTE